MIRIAICDDEKNVRSYISSLIGKQKKECNIKEYASGEELIRSGNEYDILILDIQMKTNNDGMETAKFIRKELSKSKKEPIIIFVTGYSEYVTEAFDVDAFQYLLKPINEEKFDEVFGRAVDNVKKNKEISYMPVRSLIIHFNNSNHRVSIDDVFYAESNNRKVILFLKNEVISYYARLRALEEELQGQFFRIHKGYLINLKYVEEYSKNEVILTNGAKLLISKYKYQEFVKAYLQYMNEERLYT